MKPVCNYQGRWFGLYICQYPQPPHVWQILFRVGRRRELTVEYR